MIARLRQSLDSWQRRLIFWSGGLAVGIVAAGFALAAEQAQALFHSFLAVSPLLALPISPAGFAASAWLTRRYFPGAQGSGIPQAMAARQVVDPVARRGLLSMRIACGKILLTLLGLASGASIGREGPTVQIGASILHAIGRASPNRLKGLILAGGAAGVAAAFNTPLAGIVFAIEEMDRSFEHETSGVVLVGVVLAGVTSTALLGDYTYFGHMSATLGAATDWLTVAVAGLGGGILGGCFSRVVLRTIIKGWPGRPGLFISTHPIAFAACCGLGLALIGLVTDGATYGTGYDQAKSLVEGSGQASLVFAPLKMLASLLSTLSGIPGGLFAPSLAIGAGFGADLARLLPLTSLADVIPATAMAPVILLGMVAYLAGVVQAPITAFVIVMEMTENHHMIIPLMLSAVIASGASRQVCPRPIYQALSEHFVASSTPSHTMIEAPSQG